MNKIENKEDPNSCWNKAKNNELMFILLEKDVAAPNTIRFWVTERIRLGKNKLTDYQIDSALELAKTIEEKQNAE